MKKVTFIALGCFFTAIGLLILKHSHVVTGGTAGLSLSLSYWLSFPFAYLFFLVNLPFIVLSFIGMGRKFTLNTIGAIAFLTVITDLLDRMLPDFSLPAPIGSALGGLFIGGSLIVLFSNRTSLGGANIMALFLQKKYNRDPGAAIFVFDFIVIMSSIPTVGLEKGAYSILSIVIMSGIISAFKNRFKEKNRSDSEQPAPIHHPVSASHSRSSAPL